MIPHDDHVATLQPAALLLQHPSHEIQVRNGKKNKGPFLLNEWMHSLVLTFIHSCSLFIHSQQRVGVAKGITLMRATF